MTLRPERSDNSPAEPPAFFASTIESLRVAAHTQQNPLYAWEAIARCLSYQMLPPAWCLDYLFITSAQILQLMQNVESEISEYSHATPISPKDALKKVNDILGFGSQGRNAFSRYLADITLMQDASLAELSWARGKPHTEATAKIKTRRNIASDREAERRIKAGNRLLKRID